MNRRPYRIALFVGARPNFMKAAPLVKLLRADRRFRVKMVHTGQHFDRRMSDVFFRDLGLPRPDVYFGVGSGTHAVQTGEIMRRSEEMLARFRPDLVLVVGDVNSTMAAAITAKKLHLAVAHVEAGLRSRDRDMPEEINRLVTDVLTDVHFVTCADAADNLVREGHPRAHIHFVGNLMIDSLKEHLPRARRIPLPRGLRRGDYALLTLHRPENVDQAASLEKCLDLVEMIQERHEIVFPVHPRTRKMLERTGLARRLARMPRVRLIEPLGYLEFISLMAAARFVLTDSGGIQEETTFLRIPCLTVRRNTERPVTITEGSNTLVGFDFKLIARQVALIEAGRYKKSGIPRHWDGRAAERIHRVLLRLAAARG